MSLKPTPARALSPLVIANGLVYGWAYDPLRPHLNLVLTIDGVDSGTGLTGFTVADSFFAHAVPPKANCGFCLPLPQIARDGRIHKIGVKVRDWQALAQASRVEIDWFEGPCFGEVSVNANGHYEGWVGLRHSMPEGKAPDVLVSEGLDVRFVIQPTIESGKAIDGSLALLKFKVELQQFADLHTPVFSCEGRALEFKKPGTKLKVVGRLDEIGPDGLHGWLYNAANPAESLDVVLIIDDLPHSTHRPNQLRPDIAQQLRLLPDEIGICGFDISLPAVLKDGKVHSISVRCRADGTPLNTAPVKYQHMKPGFGLEEALPLLHRTKTSSSQRRSSAARKPAAVKPQVSIIILNRNGAPCLDALFASLQAHNTVPVEIILIDHASTDTSLAVIERWEKQLPLRLVGLDDNYSFSSSCNRGAKLAKAPVLLFLNNDIVWLQDALPAMLETLQQPKTAAVGLRLLKTEFAHDSSGMTQLTQPAVQHLGVRFTLVGDQYWPFEVTPEHAALATQYSPQPMPVVTGAALLCKRKVFLDAGGFDERYFYGYEDVEFCLRLGHTGLGIVCRNDLTALHHHGYTRLTGREPGLVERQIGNQHQLATTLGLYLKRHYWQSLLAGDAQFAGEPFTVGFALDACQSPDADKTQLAAAVTLAEALSKVYPHCRVLFLTADHDWNQVSECHVLVALSHHYDLRNLKQARADLRTVLYVYNSDTEVLWSANPSRYMFDRRLNAYASTTKEPLGDLLNAANLRVRVSAAPGSKAAALLTTALKLQGALVSNADTAKVVDVIVTLVESRVESTAANAQTPVEYQRRADVINVLWLLDGGRQLRPLDVAQADLVWVSNKALPAHLKKSAKQPKTLALTEKGLAGLVKLLQKSVETKIGRSFHTP